MRTVAASAAQKAAAKRVAAASKKRKDAKAKKLAKERKDAKEAKQRQTTVRNAPVEMNSKIQSCINLSMMYPQIDLKYGDIMLTAIGMAATIGGYSDVESFYPWDQDHIQDLSKKMEDPEQWNWCLKEIKLTSTEDNGFLQNAMYKYTKIEFEKFEKAYNAGKSTTVVHTDKSSTITPFLLWSPDWSKCANDGRGVWVLNPHLSKQQAYELATTLIKQRIKNKADQKRFMPQYIKEVRKERAMKMLNQLGYSIINLYFDDPPAANKKIREIVGHLGLPNGGSERSCFERLLKWYKSFPANSSKRLELRWLAGLVMPETDDEVMARLRRKKKKKAPETSGNVAAGEAETDDGSNKRRKPEGEAKTDDKDATENPDSDSDATQDVLQQKKDAADAQQKKDADAVTTTGTADEAAPVAVTPPPIVTRLRASLPIVNETTPPPVPLPAAEDAIAKVPDAGVAKDPDAWKFVVIDLTEFEEEIDTKASKMAAKIGKGQKINYKGPKHNTKTTSTFTKPTTEWTDTYIYKLGLLQKLVLDLTTKYQGRVDGEAVMLGNSNSRHNRAEKAARKMGFMDPSFYVGGKLSKVHLERSRDLWVPAILKPSYIPLLTAAAAILDPNFAPTEKLQDHYAIALSAINKRGYSDAEKVGMKAIVQELTNQVES